MAYSSGALNEVSVLPSSRFGLVRRSLYSAVKRERIDSSEIPR